MNLKCVRMVLQYQPKDNLADVQEEAIYTFDFDGGYEPTSSELAAYEFGFFIVELDYPENHLVYRGEQFFDFDEIQPAFYDPFTWFQDPNANGGWNIDKLILKLQPYFEHQIDRTKYNYKIGFFDDTMEVNTPPKENPIFGKKPPMPPHGLMVVLSWIHKEDYTAAGSEKFVAPKYYDTPLGVLCFAQDLCLADETFPGAPGSWHLDGWLNFGQEWYLEKLYALFGEYIKHECDPSKYYYHINAYLVE